MEGNGLGRKLFVSSLTIVLLWIAIISSRYTETVVDIWMGLVCPVSLGEIGF